MGGQRHAPAALLPVKTQYPLYRGLGEYIIIIIIIIIIIYNNFVARLTVFCVRITFLLISKCLHFLEKIYWHILFVTIVGL